MSLEEIVTFKFLSGSVVNYNFLGYLQKVSYKLYVIIRMFVRYSIKRICCILKHR